MGGPSFVEWKMYKPYFDQRGCQLSHWRSTADYRRRHSVPGSFRFDNHRYRPGAAACCRRLFCPEQWRRKKMAGVRSAHAESNEKRSGPGLTRCSRSAEWWNAVLWFRETSNGGATLGGYWRHPSLYWTMIELKGSGCGGLFGPTGDSRNVINPATHKFWFFSNSSPRSTTNRFYQIDPNS